MKSTFFFLFFHISVCCIGQQNWFTTGQSADLMISGAGFNDCVGPLVFNHPSGLASNGSNLLLCDRFNNRVLIWKNAPDHWNQEPDLVLGQPDFKSNNPGRGLHQLNWPGNISTGYQVIALADTENDRILLWKSFPKYNGAPADLELSLPALTPKGSPKQYEWPWGVWTDGQRLAVVATTGAAILFWNTLPTQAAQTPDYTISLQDFGTPRNISTDGKSFFFVGDHNAKVTGKPGTFFWYAYPTQSNQNYDYYQDEWIKGIQTANGNFICGGILSYYSYTTIPSINNAQANLNFQFPYYKNGDGPDVVEANGRIYINNYNGNNLLVYNRTPTSSIEPPDWALGSYNVNVNTLDSFGYIQNPNLTSDGSRLIVTSDFDRAIYIYDQIPSQSGILPDHKYSMISYDGFCWDNALFGNQFITVGVQKICIWNELATLHQKPDRIIQKNIGTANFTDLRGVAMDADFFSIADRNGKIWIWKGLPKTLSENPFLTLDFPGFQFNQMHSDGTYLIVCSENPPSQVLIFKVSELKNGITTPWKQIGSSQSNRLNLVSSAISFNGSLAIANRGLHQVLLWKNIDDAGDFSKVIVLGQSSLQNIQPAIGSDRLFMPSTLLALDNELWVGEFKFSSRILKFSPGPTKNEDLSKSGMQNIEIFPNPIDDEFILKLTQPVHSTKGFQILDLNGRTIHCIDEIIQLSNASYRVQLNSESLTAGIYFISYKDTQQKLLAKFIRTY